MERTTSPPTSLLAPTHAEPHENSPTAALARAVLSTPPVNVARPAHLTRSLLAVLALASSCARAGEGRTADAPPLPAGALEPTAVAEPSARAVASAPRIPALAAATLADDGIELFEAPTVVQLDGFTDVFAAPRIDAERLGVIAMGERVAAHEPSSTDGCAAGWRAIEPIGFICAEVTPTRLAASSTVLPRLPRGAVVPGTYGKLDAERTRIYDALDRVAAGDEGRRPDASLTVRRLARVSHGGRSYWRTRHGYVPAQQIRKLDSSRFHGIAVGDDLAQPRVWARFRGDDGSIALRASASAGSKVVARMKARRDGRVLETSDDGRFVRVALGDGVEGWAARDDVRIARRTAAPADIGADERWLDIDVAEQVLVAYVGARPVYATLVSTGRRTHDTPLGSFRIERKLAERTMSSRPGDDDPYAVDRVPWTSYFIGSFALHAAYWHGSFGERKSHGCVNLAPIDARQLYGWTGPGVQPGWSETFATAEQPGSLVRIHDGAAIADGTQVVLAATADLGEVEG